MEMFYNKFCSIVSCSVNKAIIEEPSCTGCSELIQIFKHFISLSSQSYLHKAGEIQVLGDSLVVAVVLVSGIIFVALPCFFSILSMSRFKCGDQNCTACLRCGKQGICIMGGSVLCFCT